MDRRARTILWVDGGAGASVGVVVLGLRVWLAAFWALPPSLVLLVGTANLAYGCYSGTLAVRASLGLPPSRRAVESLIVANAAWVPISLGLLVMTWDFASAWGVAHFCLEGLFVGCLGYLESRFVRPLAR